MATKAAVRPKTHVTVTKKSGDGEKFYPIAARIFFESPEGAKQFADELNNWLEDTKRDYYGYGAGGAGRFRIDVTEITADDFETAFDDK